MAVTNNPSAVFLWARSGGGHETAKNALLNRSIEAYKKEGKTLDVQDVDITGDKILNAVKLPFVGGLGDMGVNAWNSAQKRGDLKFLSWYAAWQWLGEIIFYPIVYFRTKALLRELKGEPEMFVCTQAFCISAIVHAVQRMNYERGWNLKVQVHLTDLPSKHATHFFPSIHKVGSDETMSQLLTLHSPPPQLKSTQDEREFWEKMCGKHIRVITSNTYPIRKAFFDTEKLREQVEQPTLQLKLKNDEQLHSIKKDDKVALLMLGSQPTHQSVLNWLDTFAQAAPSGEQKRTEHLFLFCGAPATENNPNELLSAVQEKLRTLELPPHLKVTPFTFQDADTIALLLARSDCSITRSGGATCMELLHLHHSNIDRPGKLTLIHSEAELDQGEIEHEMKKMELKEQHQNLQKEELAAKASEQYLRKEGIAVWEASNAKYLENKIGAHVVNARSSRKRLAEQFFG